MHPDSEHRTSLASLLRNDAAPDQPATAGDAMPPAAVASDLPAPAAAGPATVVAAVQAEEPLPRFARRPVGVPVAPRWLWAVAAVLGLALGLQVLLADRTRLAADASTRPWVESLCGVLGCTLPAWQEPDAFSMLDRQVLPAPGQPGVLQVQASFRNDARWEQALPLIELTLSTADGQVSGQRIFAPSEYLGSDAPQRLRPGQSVQAQLLLAEPQPAAEAFHFRFR